MHVHPLLRIAQIADAIVPLKYDLTSYKPNMHSACIWSTMAMHLSHVEHPRVESQQAETITTNINTLLCANK